MFVFVLTGFERVSTDLILMPSGRLILLNRSPVSQCNQPIAGNPCTTANTTQQIASTNSVERLATRQKCLPLLRFSTSTIIEVIYFMQEFMIISLLPENTTRKDNTLHSPFLQ